MSSERVRSTFSLRVSPITCPRTFFPLSLSVCVCVIGRDRAVARGIVGAAVDQSQEHRRRDLLDRGHVRGESLHCHRCTVTFVPPPPASSPQVFVDPLWQDAEQHEEPLLSVEHQQIIFSNIKGICAHVLCERSWSVSRRPSHGHRPPGLSSHPPRQAGAIRDEIRSIRECGRDLWLGVLQ